MTYYSSNTVLVTAVIRRLETKPIGLKHFQCYICADMHVKRVLNWNLTDLSYIEYKTYCPHFSLQAIKLQYSLCVTLSSKVFQLLTSAKLFEKFGLKSGIVIFVSSN